MNCMVCGKEDSHHESEMCAECREEWEIFFKECREDFREEWEQLVEALHLSIELSMFAVDWHDDFRDSVFGLLRGINQATTAEDKRW